MSKPQPINIYLVADMLSRVRYEVWQFNSKPKISRLYACGYNGRDCSGDADMNSERRYYHWFWICLGILNLLKIIIKVKKEYSASKCGTSFSMLSTSIRPSASEVQHPTTTRTS